MRIEIKNELLVINILSVVLILIISFLPVQVLRIILGLPFILFFPGYTLIAALFPKKSDLDAMERVALSFGLSIAVVPLIGLVLNYTPWGIRLYPILLSLAFFIVAMSAIAWYRRRGLPEKEKLNLALNLSLPKQKNPSRLDRVLSTVLILAILGAIGTLGYVIASPKVGERFTEFYILGLEGKAEGYPKELTVGEAGRVILGITNHEHEIMSYEVEMMVGGTLDKETGPIELAHEQKWGEEVSFVPQEACAVTKLVEDVYQPWGPFLAEQVSIRVESIEQLKPGDHIWIESEAAQIEAVDGYTITLKEALKSYHPAGSKVTEVQKVEFRLHKIRQLGERAEKHTLLSLRIGKGNLSAKVVNQGQNKANYQIEVRVEENEEQQTRIESVGPMVLASGEEWSQEVDFASPKAGAPKLEFSLLRDGELLYKEKARGAYPALHLWIDVKESKGP